MWFAIIASLIIGGLLLYLYFPKSPKNYWKKYGIREIDTSGVLTIMDFFLGRKTILDKDDFVYKEIGNEKFGGFIEMANPMILIKDLELLKKILIKDFDHFVDRRPADVFLSQSEVMQKMLVAMSGDEWKGVRSSVSPTFTTGKIRRMMSYFNSVGKEWVEDFASKAKQSGNGSVTIEVLESVKYFTIDVIASAVFGLNAGTIKNNNSTFAKMANKFMDFYSMKQIIKFPMIFLFPRLSKFLKIGLFSNEAIAFFVGILEQGLKARMCGEVKSNDFLQLLVEAKNGELKAAGADELNTFEKDAQVGATEKKQYLTEIVMNAQSLIFFFGGFSPTSHFITMAVYSLAAYQDVQTKLREEVGKIVGPDGNFEYDEVGQLEYLEMFVCEVLRKFPGGTRLERLCVKDYKDEETGLFVPKGTLVIVPCYSLHTDPRYFHNPDGFDPEHFSPEKKAERNPYVYMPFGIGPRNCIGMRFALVESKTAIAHLVHHFFIEPTAKTPLPVKGIVAGVQFIPPKKLELKLTPVHH